MEHHTLGPLNTVLQGVIKEVESVEPNKHWSWGGKRSLAIAIHLLQKGEVIAVPTDTIYGLACCADNNSAIQKIYEIKKRDENKPLAICLGNVRDIKKYGVVDDLPPGLIETLLPGPYTIILKRTSALNPNLNPGVDNVGIRVPKCKRIRSLASITGPLALTSANLSNNPSSLQPSHFSELWPQLSGIFYDNSANSNEVLCKKRLKGSTIVDLSRSGFYTIVRPGVAEFTIEGFLKNRGFKKYDSEKEGEL